MKTRSRQLTARDGWLSKPIGSGHYRPWLLDEGSLTRRLQARCQTFRVNGLRQRRGQALRDECVALPLRAREKVLLREVFLCNGSEPLVFARSVLPRRSLRGAWHRLACLGARPLGEVLFSDPAVVRTPLAYRKLLPNHPLFRLASAGMERLPPCLWARRSVFSRYGAGILVTEVFLPGVLAR